MKKNIISALVVFFMTFAVLFAAKELSKQDQNSQQVTQSIDLDY